MQSLSARSKHVFYAGCTCLFIISTPLMSLAVTVESVPNPRQVNGGWVSDTANILNASTETKLNQMISRLEAKNGTEIAVVTVPKTAPSESSKAFATQLFNHWKVGKAAHNNGVLFLVSRGDRRVEIETGYGIESVLPNAQVNEIIQQTIVPPFKQGNFDQGTLNGTKALVTALETKTFRANAANIQASNTHSVVSSKPSPSSSITSNFNWLAFIGFLFGGWLLFTLIALVSSLHRDDNDDRRGGGGDGHRSRHYPVHSSGSYSSGSVGGSTGGGGSVGGGFGGGSSGGGGAGGSTGGGGSGGGGFGGGSSGGGGAGGGF